MRYRQDFTCYLDSLCHRSGLVPSNFFRWSVASPSSFYHIIGQVCFCRSYIFLHLFPISAPYDHAAYARLCQQPGQTHLPHWDAGCCCYLTDGGNGFESFRFQVLLPGAGSVHGCWRNDGCGHGLQALHLLCEIFRSAGPA